LPHGLQKNILKGVGGRKFFVLFGALFGAKAAWFGRFCGFVRFVAVIVRNGFAAVFEPI